MAKSNQATLNEAFKLFSKAVENGSMNEGRWEKAEEHAYRRGLRSYDLDLKSGSIVVVHEKSPFSSFKDVVVRRFPAGDDGVSRVAGVPIKFKAESKGRN